MALKWVDNFEFWTTTPATFTSTSSASIVSGRLLCSLPAAGQVISNNITAQATYILNSRLNVQQIASNGAIYEANDNNTTQWGLRIDSPDAKLRFYRGNFAGTNIGSPSSLAFIIDTNVTFYDVEAKVTINGTTGSIECRVNGGVQIGPTGSLNTQATGNATADSIIIGRGSGGTSFTCRYEHAIVMDSTGTAANDFIGPVDVVFLPPTGDGFYTAWSFTGGATRWQSVNDTNPDGDTTYISNSTLNNKNTFTHGNLPANYTAVKAAAVWVNARRDDATTRGFKVLLRNATPTDNLGAVEFFVGTAYQWFFQEYALNPFTSAAWSTTEINQVQYGVQQTT